VCAYACAYNCIQLWYTDYSTALNSSDNVHSYPPDNHYSSDDVYQMGGGISVPLSILLK